MALVNSLQITFKCKGLMRVYNKNNITDKEIRLLLWHAKQDDKAIPKHILDNLSLRIMIKPSFREVREYLIYING